MRKPSDLINLSLAPPTAALWALFAGAGLLVLLLVVLELWAFVCQPGAGGAGASSLWLCPTQSGAGETLAKAIRLCALLGTALLAIGLGFCLQRERHQRRARKSLAKDTGAADTAKLEFLANVTHELRTPLNGILGIGEVLRVTNLNQRQLDLLAVMMRSGRGLLDMVNDLLDVARIEAGKLALHRAPSEILDIFRSVDDLLRPVATARGLGLVLNLPDRPMPSALVDARALRQVLVNLVGNAIKFTETGTVTLDCKATRRSGRLALDITVADTGVGIAAENLSRIFERFFQEVHPLARNLEGTGLGLAICDEIIRKMGGRIDVTSAPGHGSRFAISVSMDIVCSNT